MSSSPRCDERRQLPAGTVRPRPAVRRTFIAALLALLVAGICASSASATVALCNVEIPMSDGVILRANLYLPSSTGHYPTVLTATGYNKDAANPSGQDCWVPRASPATNRHLPKKASP